MHHSFSPLAALSVAWLLLAAGCGDDGLRACTEIGCSHELTVMLAGDLPQEYTVSVSAPGTDTQSRDCSAGNPCAGGIVRFIDYAPDEVTVTVTSTDGSVAVTVRPAYVVSRPNGEGCPPECRQATIAITLG